MRKACEVSSGQNGLFCKALACVLLWRAGLLVVLINACELRRDERVRPSLRQARTDFPTPVGVFLSWGKQGLKCRKFPTPRNRLC